MLIQEPQSPGERSRRPFQGAQVVLAHPREMGCEAEEDIPEVRPDVPELPQVPRAAAGKALQFAHCAALLHVDLHVGDAAVQHRDRVQAGLPEPPGTHPGQVDARAAELVHAARGEVLEPLDRRPGAQVGPHGGPVRPADALRSVADGLEPGDHLLDALPPDQSRRTRRGSSGEHGGHQLVRRHDRKVDRGPPPFHEPDDHRSVMARRTDREIDTPAGRRVGGRRPPAPTATTTTASGTPGSGGSRTKGTPYPAGRVSAATRGRRHPARDSAESAHVADGPVHAGHGVLEGLLQRPHVGGGEL